MTQTSTANREKLAKYVITLITIALAAGVCWLLSGTLTYIILASVISLLAAPLARLFRKIRIGSSHCPLWLCSILAIIVIFSILTGLITLTIPIIGAIAHDVSMANVSQITNAASLPLADLNRWVIKIFPNSGPDFHIESVIVERLQDFFDMSIVTSMVGSVTYFLTSLGVTLFATIFIAFFFIKEPGLISKVVVALSPEKYKHKSKAALIRIGYLVSRYLVGISIEVLGVSLLNFIGLFFVAKMGLRYSIGIAFLTGILNLIPYIGPFIGYILGICLSLVIKYACASAFGLAVSFPVFLLVIMGVLLFTQIIDIYIFQPVIYSTSIKVHPLEIFIVFLVAGELGGIVGMLVAIPAYTVVREIAKQFFPDSRFVKLISPASPGQK